MRTKILEHSVSPKHKDIDIENMCSDAETIYYECPCGKGAIIEEHDYTPGFKDHDVYIRCKECNMKYELDLSRGVRNWELVKK